MASTQETSLQIRVISKELKDLQTKNNQQAIAIVFLKQLLLKKGVFTNDEYEQFKGEFFQKAEASSRIPVQHPQIVPLKG